MKIIHTADLHLGQVIYQHYERSDEHRHFFAQLEEWCRDEQPDALVVSGDIFDIQQPSATTKKAFTEYFVGLHDRFPDMHIVVIAGNHDSASRIQADSAVWERVNVHLVGTAPAMGLLEGEDGWQDDYIVTLESGFIVALPYMIGNREAQIQSILDRVDAMNAEGKPVVITGHLAVTGMDPNGHDMQIGTIRTQGVEELGHGYDYMALGHIHMPQTIGHQEDNGKMDVTYPSGVVRYSGSALHVSCDEQYPHTVSVVEMARRGGDVRIRQLRIDELRHFYVLPLDRESYGSEEEALTGIRLFITRYGRGYIRLKISCQAAISSDFDQKVYDLLAPTGEEVRYNPKTVWTGLEGQEKKDTDQPVFEVADLQQMTDPFEFIEKTKEQYPDLDMEDLRKAFEEVREEMSRMAEEKDGGKTGRKQEK